MSLYQRWGIGPPQRLQPHWGMQPLSPLSVGTLRNVAAPANIHNLLKPVFGKSGFLGDVAAELLGFARAAELRSSAVASATEANTNAVASMAKISLLDIASPSELNDWTNSLPSLPRSGDFNSTSSRIPARAPRDTANGVRTGKRLAGKLHEPFERIPYN